jgi:hypothetical protein
LLSAKDYTMTEVVIVIQSMAILYLVYRYRQLERSIINLNKAYTEMIDWMIKQELVNQTIGIALVEVRKFIKNLAEKN